MQLSTQATNITAAAEAITEATRTAGRTYIRSPNQYTLRDEAELFDAARLLRAAADTLDAIRAAADARKI